MGLHPHVARDPGYRAEGQIHSSGPTDRLFTESEIDLLTQLGLIPVVAVHGRDVALVASLRSLAGVPLFPEGCSG
jgi:hypothetical protein